MDNLQLYEKVRAVPKEAQKEIGGGRLKGMTDINPMWRIKTLTEEFGACGLGWKYEVMKQWLEPNIHTREVCAFCNINLYVKFGEIWSEPIFGTGGSAFSAEEKGGIYTNDEAYKMALTDAISVACKSLGIGADIYWQKDNTKYNDDKKKNLEKPAEKKVELNIDPKTLERAKVLKIDPAKVATYNKISIEELTTEIMEAAIKQQIEAMAKIKAEKEAKAKKEAEAENAEN